MFLLPIEAAVRQVLNGDEAGAHVIVVTRGDNDTLNFADQNEILELAKSYQVRFSSLLVPRFGASALSFYDTVSQLTDGRSFVFSLPKDNKKDNIGKLNF